MLLVEIRTVDDGTRWQTTGGLRLCGCRAAEHPRVRGFPTHSLRRCPSSRSEIELTPRADGTVAYRADLGVDEVGFDSGNRREGSPEGGRPRRRRRDGDGSPA
jgi:hypothetical protein